MNVTLCIDALAPNPGGIGRYTWELYKGLEVHDDIRFYWPFSVSIGCSKTPLLCCVASALFVYPSIYEGFGLPPLEAMVRRAGEDVASIMPARSMRQRGPLRRSG